MSKVLLSFSTPRMDPVFRLVYPTFERFALEHGYDIHIERPTEYVDTDPLGRRALRWHKIDMLRRASEAHSVVLWIDADAFFVRWDRDIVDDLAAHSFQGLVLERRPDRVNPNTGVWVLRGSDTARRFLRQVQEIGQLDHSWSDQASVCRVLGWGLGDYHGHGAAPDTATPFARASTWLAPCWNAIGDLRGGSVRVRHLAGMPIEDRIHLVRTEVGGRLLECCGTVMR